MSEIQALKKALDRQRIDHYENAELKRYTTFRIGGPARLLVFPDNSRRLLPVVESAAEFGLPCKVLGMGSNVLVSDLGFDGVVIINRSTHWQIRRSESLPGSGENAADVIVRVDSGMPINRLMQTLFKEGITGLEWFAGIPATVGGAIYMNMHGGDYFFGDLVSNVALFDGQSARIVNGAYFQFEYDRSRLHDIRELILWADLRLKKGNVEDARKRALQQLKSKSHYPHRSAGCVFRNLSEKDRQRLNLPTASVGYIMDKVLQLKGYRIGDAIISHHHAAFIENIGNARATDVNQLIKLMQTKAAEQLGVDLKLEIELIGNFEGKIAED
ncbi:MAG: UDP-N-acetylmuramate dehydrogenase [Candidatus Marinimicrobia bacterium]|nr:UDP-N-acetylmuramate dehydrogenase [Candidatus Neomarinimicrobiota bacterium]